MIRLTILKYNYSSLGHVQASLPATLSPLIIGTWVLTVVSLVGTALNVKKIKWCFYLWTVSNILWLAYDLYTGLYSRAVLDAVHLGFAIWGIIAWGKKK